MTPLYSDRIVDRQIGRNAQLFAQEIIGLDSPEKRYPYIRILVGMIEQAHTEMAHAPEKDVHIAEIAEELSGGALDREEVALAVRARDEERGYRN